MTAQNEKYVGDSLQQKTFSEDLFDGQRLKNEGQLPKYYVHDCHPAIIDRFTFQRVQEELARRSSLRKASSRTKTEQGKYSGKYVLSGLLVCGECGSPYRRTTYMPGGQKRYVWRCINRLEHGKRICKHAPTLEESELHAAVTAAMNEMFRQRTAKELLAQCVAAALADKQADRLTLPAVEARLRAIQERQMELFRLASANVECTEYDEEIGRLSTAKMSLQAQKEKLEREGRTDTAYDSRVQSIANTLEHIDSAIEGFDEAMVRQTVASITVLDRERLSVRFKDGTEIEQRIESVGRASA